MRLVFACCVVILALFPGTGSAAPLTFQPDLTVELAATPQQVAAGQEVTYSLTVKNVGQLAYNDPRTGPVYFNTPASGIGLLLTLPTGVTYRSVVGASGFVCASVVPVVTCSGGSLGATQSAVIVVKATAPLTAGNLSSSATVDPTNAIGERSETNNSATATTSVPLADLSVRVASTRTTVDDQATLGYRVYVDNIGQGTEATGVTVRVTLPGGSTYYGAADGVPYWLDRTYLAGFACSRVGDVVTCTGGRIGSGQTGAVEISTAAPRINGQITVSATADPNNALAERDEGNNSASATVTVNGRPDLTVSGRYGWLVPGFVLARHVTVTNQGIGPASAIEVSIDALTSDPPPGTAGADVLVTPFVTDHGFSCSRTGAAWPTDLYEDGDRIRCTGGSIAAGGSATITVYHQLHWNSPYRRTRVSVDGPNTIREANESNNSALVAQNVW